MVTVSSYCRRGPVGKIFSSPRSGSWRSAAATAFGIPHGFISCSGVPSEACEMKPAVVLLSGGVDSATTLAIARNQGFLPYALSFAYGQRHSRQLESATRVAAALCSKEHRILTLDLRLIGGSALTREIAVPKGRSLEEIGSGIPVTYVPARNTIFLAHALAWAEVLGAEDVFFGANIVDYSGYPDCRPEYTEAFERMANLATKAGGEGRSRVKEIGEHTSELQ